MAFIHERQNKKSKTYYVHYYHGGKLYREKVGKNKEAAQMRLGEIIRKIEMGQFSPNSDAPLSSLIKHYRESLMAEPHSDSHRKRLDVLINNFERYQESEKIKRVNQVDFSLLDNYIMYRVNQDKIAPRTANSEIGFLKRLFKFALKHKYVMESPAKELTLRKVARKEPRYFSHEEIELLLEKAGKYEAFFMVMLHTGLRGSDAGNLRWSDVDFDKGFIRVITKKTGQRITIPINDTLSSYLLDYGTETPQLFPEMDTDTKRQKVRMRIQRVLRDAGYQWKGIGCHAFRHTFASHLVINGASIYDVQKLLGHSSITMTEIYAHLSENATRRAVDLIDFNPKNVIKTGLKPVGSGLKRP